MLLSALTLKQERFSNSVISAGDDVTTDAAGTTAASDAMPAAGNNTNPGGLSPLGTWQRAQDRGNQSQHPSGFQLQTDGSVNTTENTEFLTLAVQNTSFALDLSQVSAGVFEKAIENVVFLRAQSGGGMTRLNFALDSIATQETNMKSALGRIEDVDIAEESANLARYSILMQASAAMAVQANLQNEVALMLLR